MRCVGEMIGMALALPALLARVAAAPHQELSQRLVLDSDLRRQLRGNGERLGLFKDVQPCEALLAIIGDSNTTTPEWGYFKEPPSQSLIQSCVESSAVLISDGLKFQFALRDPSPTVKVLRADGFLRVEYNTGSPLFCPGSVVVLDCQNNWVDFREMEVDVADAVVVYYQCHILLNPDRQASASQTWTFSSSTHLQCTANSTYFQDSPGFFNDYHLVFGPTTAHMLNHTHWCWTDSILQGVLPDTQNKNAPRRQWWILFVVLTGLMVCTGVLLYFLSPCCMKALRKRYEDSKPPVSQEAANVSRTVPGAQLTRTLQSDVHSAAHAVK